MGLDGEFHEMFYVPEVASDRKRCKSSASERQRLRQAARGRGLRLEQLAMQQVLQRDKERPRPAPGSSVSTQFATKALTDSLTTSTPPPLIELNGNPSNFTVYAAIRQSVLEAKLRRSTMLYNQTVQAVQSGDDQTDQDDDDKKLLREMLKVLLHLR